MTFDPSEWITLGEAAEILQNRFDFDDGGRRRLRNLLRQRPSIARLVTSSLPSPVNADIRRVGIIPLPDRCLWPNVAEIDWAASEVRAFPFLSGTDWDEWYPRDYMLTVRVQRTEVVEAAQNERDDDERGRAKRREVTERLFREAFWPVPRVLAWIAFRNEAAIRASLGAASWYITQAIWQMRDTNRQETLLRALQDGSLPALKDGSELRREAWAGANGRDWPAVHFRREDVLALWPQVPLAKPVSAPGKSRSADGVTTRLASSAPAFEPTEIAPIRNRPGRDSAKMDAAIAAMCRAVEQGKISVIDLRQKRQKSLVELYPHAKRTLLAEARRRALLQITAEQARRQNSDKLPTNDK